MEYAEARQKLISQLIEDLDVTSAEFGNAFHVADSERAVRALYDLEAIVERLVATW